MAESQPDDPVKEAFYKFVASPLAPQFPSAQEEQEALWFFRAGHASAGLVWTHAQPVQDGFYWTSQVNDPDDDDDQKMVWVWFSRYGGLCVEEADSFIPAEDILWWSGPITRPSKPDV